MKVCFPVLRANCPESWTLQSWKAETPKSDKGSFVPVSSLRKPERKRDWVQKRVLLSLSNLTLCHRIVTSSVVLNIITAYFCELIESDYIQPGARRWRKGHGNVTQWNVNLVKAPRSWRRKPILEERKRKRKLHTKFPELADCCESSFVRVDPSMGDATLLVNSAGALTITRESFDDRYHDLFV